MAAKLNQSDDKLNTDDAPGVLREGSPGLRVLKIATVVMGILIIAGLIVIVTTIAKRMGEKMEEAPAVQAAPLGDIDVALPAGSRVLSVSVDGGRIYVDLEAAGGARSVMVLDAATGEQVGSVNLKTSQ